MNITGLIITDSGCEEACRREIARWVKAKPDVRSNVLVLHTTLADAVTLGCYLQTARRVMIQLTEPLKEINELEKRTPDVEIMKNIFPENLTFKAEADALAITLDGKEHSLPLGQELIEALGEWIYNAGRKVDLRRPDITVHAIATPESVYIGVDVIGRSLSKREHRIMLSRKSIKATIAAALVVYSGATEKDVIMNPFADDGSIAIEAALLLSRTSPLQFARNMSFEKFPAYNDKWKVAVKNVEKILAFANMMHDMKAIRTNSKLATVEKMVHATKVSADWIDVKVDEDSVDCVITQPIVSSKVVNEKVAGKLNDQLFYQSEYVLKKGRTITCLTDKKDELLPPAEKYGFTFVEERKVLMGKRPMTIITFKNNKSKKKDE